MLTTPFFNWAAAYPHIRGPWLVIGKGPTFDNTANINIGDYVVLGLNDVCRQMPVDLAHVTDADVLDRSAGAFALVPWVIMPYYPHINCEPQRLLSVMKIARNQNAPGHKVMRTLIDDGRLLVYRSSRSAQFKHPKTIGPTVRVKAFSAVAAVNLLGEAFKLYSKPPNRIYTLGVDGGTKYAKAFSDMIPLTNGQSSFDVQYPELQAAEKRYGLRVIPLGRKDSP